MDGGSSRSFIMAFYVRGQYLAVDLYRLIMIPRYGNAKKFKIRKLGCFNICSLFKNSKTNDPISIIFRRHIDYDLLIQVIFYLLQMDVSLIIIYHTSLWYKSITPLSAFIIINFINNLICTGTINSIYY